MRPFPLLLVVGLAALTAAPLALGAANGCAVFSPGAGALPATPVSGPYLSTLGPACGGGLTFASATPACPALLFPNTVAGAYCGPVAGVLPGATVTCTAWSPGAVFPALVVGLDETNTGNIGTIPLLAAQLAYDGPFPGAFHTVTMTNAALLPAMVIAYPVAYPSYLGPFIVDCV